MGKFEKEKAFVLLVAHGTFSKEERVKFEELLSAGLEWDYVLGQVKRHRLFPLFASHLQSCTMTKKVEEILNKVKNRYTQSVKLSRLLDTELCRLAKSLEDRDITYAVLKGPILANAIYSEMNRRTYDDIDILVKKSDAGAVTTILKEEGYVQGRFDDRKKEIIPAPRKNIIWASMYTHQLYPFHKLVEQSLIAVDVQQEFFPLYRRRNQKNFNIDLSRFSEWESQQILQKVRVNGSLISTLNYNCFLLQLCLHAYADEISILRIVYEYGASLRAYCDIRELLISKENEIKLDVFCKLVQNTETNKPVYYMLKNLSSIYKNLTKIISPILEQIRPIRLEFMNEFGHSWETIGEQKGKFSRAFIDRIFDDSCKEDYEKQKALFVEPSRDKLGSGSGLKYWEQ